MFFLCQLIFAEWEVQDFALKYRFCLYSAIFPCRRKFIMFTWNMYYMTAPGFILARVVPVKNENGRKFTLKNNGDV